MLQYATVHVGHCNFVAYARIDQSAWSVLVYVTRLQRATCTVQVAYCNLVAQQTCVTKLQMRHWSKAVDIVCVFICSFFAGMGPAYSGPQSQDLM